MFASRFSKPLILGSSGWDFGEAQLTRAKQLAIFVGSRKAFAMAVGQIDNRKRQTALTELVGAQ